MTLFIYEHLTSGALSDKPYSPDLMHEGNAMLQAICTDLVALGHRLTVMRDARLNNDFYIQAQIELLEICDVGQYQAAWQQALSHYQLFVIIAPETNGVLAQRTQELERYNKTILGCNSTSIQLCSDKLACFKHLQQYALPTPYTQLAEDWRNDSKQTNSHWVVKPRDGAGCEDTYRFNSAELEANLPDLIKNHPRQCIVQPYIEGQDLSLSLFISDRSIELVSINVQHIDIMEQKLNLLNCKPHQAGFLDETRALALANSIHATMPGLWGFVGIDLIQTQDRLWIIDINPRLTSSYAESAMREQMNPAIPLHQSLTHRLPAHYE